MGTQRDLTYARDIGRMAYLMQQPLTVCPLNFDLDMQEAFIAGWDEERSEFHTHLNLWAYAARTRRN